MNKKQIGLTIVGLYSLATMGRNLELYFDKLRPLEKEFTQVCEEVVETHGIPIPTRVLESTGGPLTNLANERKQLVKEYHAIDTGSSWKLTPDGANIKTRIYLWHPFHRI